MAIGSENRPGSQGWTTRLRILDELGLRIKRANGYGQEYREAVMARQPRVAAAATLGNRIPISLNPNGVGFSLLRPYPT